MSDHVFLMPPPNAPLYHTDTGRYLEPDAAGIVTVFASEADLYRARGYTDPVPPATAAPPVTDGGSKAKTGDV